MNITTAFILGFMLSVIIAGMMICLSMWFVKHSNNKAESKLQTYKTLLQRYTLKEIYKGEINKADIKSILEKNKISYGLAPYSFVIFSYLNQEASIKGKDFEKEQIIHELNGYFTKNINEVFIPVIDIDNVFAVLFCNADEINFNKLLSGAVHLLDTNGISSVAVKSNLFDDISSIAKFYSETKDILAFKYFSDEGPILHAENIKDVKIKYNSSSERKLINALVLNDKYAATELIEEFYLMNQGEEKSIAHLRILCFEIVNSVVRAKEQMNSEVDYKCLYQSYRIILSTDKADELKQLSLDFALSACVASPAKGNRKNSEKYQTIAKYIEDNCTNHMLNVNMVSDVFGMNRTYLSDVFKKKTGIGIADYIVKLRLEKAKEMLKGDHSVAEAAESSGFSSAVVFSRSFKKYEGMTPGKYKSMYAKNNDINPG